MGVSAFLPLHLPPVPHEIPTDQKMGEERVKLRGRWKRIDSSLEAAQMSGPAAAQDCQPKGGGKGRESSRADGLARARGTEAAAITVTSRIPLVHSCLQSSFKSIILLESHGFPGHSMAGGGGTHLAG